MQALDLPCNPSIDPVVPDPSTMPENSSPIHDHSAVNPVNSKTHIGSDANGDNSKEDSSRIDGVGKYNDSSSVVVRRERPSRACTQRAAARLQAAAEAEAIAGAARKRKKAKPRGARREETEEEEEEEEDEEEGENGECSKMVTPLVGELELSQLPRSNIRSMWQLASVFNFLNVFRSLLNIKVEFSAEEFETALLTPNNTLGDVHMSLLKAIPPVTRMALGHGTWITVLCRKLRDWWHWVAEGDLPIVAAQGAEIEAYKALDPGVRVVILKALCDIRVEQEDIRNYIDDSIKQGVHLSAFRKERIGGDSHGVSYWYEDDPMIGHRLYREIRKVEVKKGKGKNIPPIPHSSYHWEAVATNLDEFMNVSEKLFTSKNRTEVSVGKKLKNDMLPEIEKVHKRKEKQLKKQHRQALMLDNMINMDGIAAGRSLRDRKPVTYTFDDYDRSISEAIKVTTTKTQPPPGPFERRDPLVKPEAPANGRLRGHSQHSQLDSFSAVSPKSSDSDELYDDKETETLDRSGRRRQRPQRYSVDDFVETASDNDADFESDDDIVGEVVYDDEYLQRKKQRRKTSSSSEGDDEYHMEEEFREEEDEEEEEEEEDDSLSSSEESDEPRRRRHKAMPARTRRETKKLRSVDGHQSGLRRSKRATRNRIDYRQIEMSESETESMKPEKSNAMYEPSGASELSTGSQDSDEKTNMQETPADPPPDEMETGPLEQSNSGDQEVKKPRFLDLNELAPGSGFDDGPTSTRDEIPPSGPSQS
ncbi:hypothetical protein ACS0TY_035220 [Phlomoides rotata]